MIVYKVVSTRNNKYRSAIIINAAMIEYKLGELIKPRFGKIFVFKDKSRAIAWSERGLQAVLECETDDIPELLILVENFTLSFRVLRHWWNHDKKAEEGEWAPIETYGVKSLTPRRVVA